ncbi:hypothetical protein [Brachybacterium phenoliresistens]|uniref:hypothetical protein n=1 Tax=Brachybacterium phenoliresistens TaxID=396014 RepID=UPI0031E086EC
MSDGTTTWTRWTGVIDSTSGDAAGGYRSKIIDHRDRIAGTFTHEALLRHMTPRLAGGPYRSISLSHWVPLVGALRSAGICNVPPAEGPGALSVPLQGTVWPEGGSVDTAQGMTVGTHATFYPAPWGYAAARLRASYIPRLAEPSTTPVQITMVIGEPPSQTDARASIRAYYGGGNYVELRLNPNQNVVASTNANSTVAVLSAGARAGAEIVTLLVKGSTWRIRASNGVEATGTQEVPAGTMSRVDVSVDEARIAGVQVSHPNTTAREFASLGFVPAMKFTPSPMVSTMDMSPAFRQRSVRDLVDEILTSTLTASWWDETGTLVLTPSDVLRSGAPVQTVTTLDDITSLEWEDSLLSARSSVVVAWKSPVISRSQWAAQELWRGAATRLLNGDQLETFVTPEGDECWFGVDRTVRKLDDTNWGAYNARLGTYAGIWYSDASGEEIPTTSSSVTVTSSNKYADSLIITHQVNGMPSGAEGNTATSPNSAAIKPYLRSDPLPVVRGFGRGEWIDEKHTVTGGLAAAPILEHDLGYWGGAFFDGGSVAQRLADFLAGQVLAPTPTITDMGLVYDPRRQIGDVITVRSERLGIELRAVIASLSETHQKGAAQKVAVRVISATTIRPVTYEDLAAAWAPSNYAGLAAAWSALTYSDFVADPLEGSP